MSDLKDLLKRCQDGDLFAFNQLFRSYEGKVFRLAMSILQDVHDAEDAVQDVFLRVFLKVRGYRGESSFDTWVTAIVVNVCRDHLRRKKLRKLVSLEWIHAYRDPSQPEVPEIVAGMQQANRLWRLVARLDDRLRIPVILVYQEGLTVKEAALALGLPVSTVYSQISSAHKQLRILRSSTGYLDTEQLGEKGC